MKQRATPRSGRGDLVTMSFGKNILKLAHLKVSAMKKRVILNLVSEDIGGLSDDEISEIVKSSLNKMKVRNPNIIAIVPSSSSITKNIEVPSANPREIKEIIDLQAGRYTPYTREEVIIDYLDIEIHRASYTKILLIMVNRDVVRRQFEIAKKANLEIDKVVFEPEGVNRLLSKILRLESQESPVGTIHIDSSSINFSIGLKGKLVFNRNISFDSQELLQEKEEYAERCCKDVEEFLESYGNEKIGQSPQSLILTGAIKNVQKLEDGLKKTLSLPIKSFPYQENLSISSQALKVISENDRLSFLDVIAPLLIPEQLKVDLLPDEVKTNRALKEKGKNIIQTGILLITILALICGLLISKIYFKTLYLEKLKEQYQPINRGAQTLTGTFSKIQMVKKYLSTRGAPLKVLSELYDLIPLEIYLKDIKFNQREGTFSLRGTSTSRNLIYSFVEKMEKSEYFQEVKTSDTKKRQEKGKNVIDFEVVATLEVK